MTDCTRCGNYGECGGQTGLCSACWWQVAAWPDCRLGLSIDEKSKLMREKETYGIRD